MNLRSLAAALLCASSLGASAATEMQQILLVDDAHTQIGLPEGKENPAYKLAPAPTLIVDAHKYTFKLPPKFGTLPINSLQVILGQDLQYSVAWDPKQAIAMISAQTARPNPGSKPFPGFVAGQKVVLAIGALNGTGFNVVWVGLADVK